MQREIYRRPAGFYRNVGKGLAKRAGMSVVKIDSERAILVEGGADEFAPKLKEAAGMRGFAIMVPHGEDYHWFLDLLWRVTAAYAGMPRLIMNRKTVTQMVEAVMSTAKCERKSARNRARRSGPAGRPKRDRPAPREASIGAKAKAAAKMALAASGTTDEICSHDTVEWRAEFMRTIPCWSRKQLIRRLGADSGKSDRVRAWINEGKIFSVSYEDQEWFPKFQFQNMMPIPCISKVMSAFPRGTTGWSIAFFFANPNAYIGGVKPLNLIESDSRQLISLAQRYVHPEDVF